MATYLYVAGTGLQIVAFGLGGVNVHVFAGCLTIYGATIWLLGFVK